MTGPGRTVARLLVGVSAVLAIGCGSDDSPRTSTYSATTADQQTSGCRATSYLPSMSTVVMQHESGTQIAFQHVGSAAISVAVSSSDGRYAGEYDPPYPFYGGEIRLELKSGFELMPNLEGEVVREFKQTTVLVACGWWTQVGGRTDIW